MKSKVNGGYSVISLFSGCGGMDMGFLGGFKSLGQSYERLPFNIIWANDINPAACATYSHNIGEPIHCGDIWGNMNSLPSRADVVIGGFPCQDVSINGLGVGADGERTNLYRAMTEVIMRVKPKIFVAENVKGLLLERHKQYRNRIVEDFESAGYKVSLPLYLSADYGVPQMRERVFIVGTRGRAKSFVHPPPALAPSGHIGARAAVRDLESVAENKETNHVWSKAKPSSDQGDRRMKADKPADTIRAECHGNIQFHYCLPRRISMREAARFQSFPDDFVFHCGIRQMERQIGNAVPPVLAWHVAKAAAENLGQLP